ncbi:MAG TPA: DUF1015 domain-containing protein [Candidatus Fimousia stercorigallinarum]|nr:DUF1015 domain-containing protein [Candidatus Fimousia stercorigallinarum]
MAIVRPFCAVRPRSDIADQVAALPYDVYNRQEAREAVKGKPYSFLNIDRPETQLDPSVDIYSDIVYETANHLLRKHIESGVFIQDRFPCYYIYELIMDGRHQTGIVGCASIDDYIDGTIKQHEKTRADKEIDRIRHVDACNAQTGPIFLAYRSQKEINLIVKEIQSETKPICDFVADDGIEHRIWRISNPVIIDDLQSAFQKLPNLYIADGHHRAASAVKVGLGRRNADPDYTGTEEYNYFLSVLFPDDQLCIMDYNRTVRDLNGYSKTEFLEKIEEYFTVTEVGKEAYRPQEKHTFGMYLDSNWYELRLKEEWFTDDPVKSLDVSILQDYLLDPILGIHDPKTDDRIDFIGGIRGLKELERRADSDMRVSFSLYPTNISELLAVADADRLMPPKSTWFEPKLRSGLFLHLI